VGDDHFAATPTLQKSSEDLTAKVCDARNVPLLALPFAFIVVALFAMQNSSICFRQLSS
jgi:hypothetical protein